MPEKFFTPETAADAIGQTFVSKWITVEQDRITAFGEITEDPDPHHMDPAFCAEHSPWGMPIAFGFLTISLLTPMLYDVYRYPLDGDPAEGYPANYGFERLRLIAPVPAGSRIRGRFAPTSVTTRKPGQEMLSMDVLVELEGGPAPVLSCTWHMLWITPVLPEPV